MVQQGKRTSDSRVVVALGIAAVFVCAASGWLILRRQNQTSQRLTVKQVQQQIDGNIPIGSTRAAVESYLDSRSITHSYVAGSGSGNERNVEVALIRGTSNSPLVKGDIQVRFQFNDSGHLTDYHVNVVFTGP
jgi:hypothetical protein